MEHTISERLKNGRGEQVVFYHYWQVNFTFWGLCSKKFIGIGKGETDLMPQIGKTGPTPYK